jgi:hypothetical protein
VVGCAAKGPDWFCVTVDLFVGGLLKCNAQQVAELFTKLSMWKVMTEQHASATQKWLDLSESE